MATTGNAPLPDIGVLSYNGVTFSCLTTTRLSGKPVPDAANRTTKYVEWTLSVDAVCTLETGHATIDPTFQAMRELLDSPAGVLTYSGKGFGDCIINQSRDILYQGGLRDVAWGPVPRVLEFQPLGASRSALVKWQVTFRLFEHAVKPGAVLQFNEETTVGYDDEDYSTLDIRGTLEIAMTRRTVGDRSLQQTVDTFRQKFMDYVGRSIDLTRFRITRREFNVSRDKRTMEWSFTAEEQPPMGNPPGIPKARGTYSVYPQKTAKILSGITIWTCVLRCTYTVAKDNPRRLAWLAFLKLLKFRLASASAGEMPVSTAADAAAAGAGVFLNMARGAGLAINGLLPEFLRRQLVLAPFTNARRKAKALLKEIRIDEGLMEDSRTITFTATWSLFTSFTHILLAAGIWRWAPDTLGGNNWATSVRNISGSRGNLVNQIDQAGDIIVDFGGPPASFFAEQNPLPKLPRGA